jgi:modulator of FtsH protease HflC
MSKAIVLRIILAAGILLILLIFMTVYQVQQGESAVLTRLGQPVRVVHEPGLYGKWPWPIESVSRFDARLNFSDIRISEALTKDKRNIIVPIFVVWHIEDPLRFLEALGGSVENAESKLDSLVGSARNTLLGGYDFGQLVSVHPEDVRLEELERKIKDATAPQAARSFGIAIEQIGIKRLTLPEVNTRYVLDRMSAERAQFAERYRAEGRQQAEEITARTDAERSVILANAQKEAEEKKGQADADAARIYAVAHAQAPDFYKFLGSIQALEKVVNQNTTLVIDENSSPFDLLKGPPVIALPPAKPSSVAKP